MMSVRGTIQQIIVHTVRFLWAKGSGTHLFDIHKIVQDASRRQGMNSSERHKDDLGFLSAANAEAA